MTAVPPFIREAKDLENANASSKPNPCPIFPRTPEIEIIREDRSYSFVNRIQYYQSWGIPTASQSFCFLECVRGVELK